MTTQALKIHTRTYHWSGHDTQGKPQQGEIAAVSPNLARHYLQQLGITPTQIRKRWLIRFKRRQTLSRRDMVIFYRQLATLLTAGVPLAHSLHMLAQHARAPLLQKVIATLQQTIEAGQPLSSGLRQFTHLIDPLTCHLIYVAEETGTLDTILHRISDYQEQRLALTNRIKQALFYPALIVIAAIIVSLTMLLFVIPRFAELFANFHAELPLLTRIIVHFSHLIRHDGWLGVIPLGGLYYGYRYYRDPARQSVLQQGLFKLPGFGPFAKKLLLARFTRTLATLLSAGIPITDALKMLIQATHFKLYQIAVSSLHQEITAGMRLHQAMQQNTLFPPLLIQMIQVGEESGSLDRMLANSAEFYEAEIDYWLKNLGNLLEPLIIIVLGVLIGGIVIAMYLPIFQLGTVM